MSESIIEHWLSWFARRAACVPIALEKAGDAKKSKAA